MALENENIEDMIVDSMLVEDRSTDFMGMTAFESMNQEDKTRYSKMAYDYLMGRYQSRDQDKYGRLSFQDYSTGLRPEEEFITTLSKLPVDATLDNAENKSQVALLWNQIFGESMDEMRTAAFGHETMAMPKNEMPIIEGYGR